MSQKSTILVSRTYKVVGIMTLLTSIMWLALGVYNAARDPIDLAVDPALLEPLDPSLDTETLEMLTQKRQLTEDSAATDALRQAIELAATPTPAAASRPTINVIEPGTDEPTSPEPTASSIPTVTSTPTPAPTDAASGAL